MSPGDKPIRVIKQDYHRNGIGGAGFVVSLVEWPEGAADAKAAGSHSGLFVTISFPNWDNENDTEYMRAHTAALNIGQLAEGQIMMYEDNAAWRGADRLGPAVVDEWMLENERRSSRFMAQELDPS